MFALISSSILLLMYFIVFILFSLLFWFAMGENVISLTLALLITVVFVLIQFFLSPIIYDFMLKWIYNAKFVSLEELPFSIAEFIRTKFQEKKVKLPKIGIIEDYTPTAFTYGNFPSNARIVVSRGLIEMMDEEELKSVISHEIGHIFHYDFIFMTLAALIPILLYYIYRIAYSISQSSRGSRNRGAGGIIILAFVSYILYIISEYIVLYLSRLREYYADKYSAYLTGNPNALATALIKVGYGLLNFQSQSASSEEPSEKPSFYKSPFKVLGLMDSKQAKGISLAVLNSGVLVMDKTIDTTNSNIATAIGKVMAWDLFNPWATILELSSTHPLIAKRIKNLYNISREMGLPFNIEIPKSLPREESEGIDLNPTSLWDEFFIDLFFEYSPFIFAVLGLLGGFALTLVFNINLIIPIFLGGLALGSFLKWLFAYKGNFKELKIFDLLAKTKVSRIRAIPAIIGGQIVGRGVAGYIFSEDVLLKDDTGFVYVDYKTGFSWGDLAYGFFVTKNLIGKKAKMKGYFRRAIFPYFEVVEITTEDGKIYRSYFKYLWLAAIFVLFIISFITLFLLL